MKLAILSIAAATALMPLAASAESHVFNATTDDIRVFFSAGGCAKTKSKLSCIGGAQAFVCAQRNLGPGEKGSYSFPDGTSDRHVVVQHCGDKNYDNRANTDNGGKKKHCAFYADASKGAGYNVRCGYSDSEWKDCQDNSSCAK